MQRMLKLLIVDDEWFAVKAIEKSVDFAALGIVEVYTASGANEAKAVLETHDVDLMICDIEMPGMNGLELTRWANERRPGVETIFLTAHAEFSYAQTAVRLASFAYLLKPVKPEQLAATIEEAAAKIAANRETSDIVEASRIYRRMWESQRAIVVERFWQNLLSGRTAPSLERLQSVQLPLTPESHVLPILISVEQWHREFSARDEDMMEYALRNAAAELMLKDFAGDVMKDESGILFALIYGGDDGGGLTPERFEGACRAFIEACRKYFYCTVSCYIGHAAPVSALTDVYHRLIELERDNVASPSAVFRLDAPRAAVSSGKRTPPALPWSDWVVLFESGNRDELRRRIRALFDEFRAAHADVESASALYHALLHMVYHVAHKNGLSVKEWPSLRNRPGLTAIRSISQLQAWAEWLIDAASRDLDRHRDESSALIERTKAYIHANLKDVTREKVADHIYLNSAYLSRLFKRCTGQTLIDFIIHAKMEKAKQLLTETNMRIVDICEEIGYENYSHFGQAFKKRVGMSLLDFRKRYQNINVK